MTLITLSDQDRFYLSDIDTNFTRLVDGSHEFADLSLESGAVITWDTTDITLTHSANTLTFAGMSSLVLGSSTLSCGAITASSGVANTALTLSSSDADCQIYMSDDSTTEFATLVRTGNDLKLIPGGSGSVIFAGDVYTTAWTDYSGTSTITGWSSTTTSVIRYKKIGNFVFVDYFIEGTSNATTVSFTLPYTSANTTVPFFTAVYVVDNGSAVVTPGRANLQANSSTLNINKDFAGAAFTNSGTKSVAGQFFYEAQ